MEKAICTLFFLKISRKICVSPKIHGGQPKNQNDKKFAGNKKQKCRKNRLKPPRGRLRLTETKKRYVRGINCAIM